MLGHPSVFIRMINEEKDNYDDGLMQRFLICCPKPLLCSFDEIKNTPVPKIPLVKILFVIAELHKAQKEYLLSDKAIDTYGSYYSKFRMFVRKCDTVDGFLSAMFGKAATMLLRLAGALKAFKTSTQFLEEHLCIGGFDKRRLNVLDAEFINWVEINLHKISEKAESFLVDSETIDEAARMLDYFNINRLKLAGYSIGNQPIELECLVELLEGASSVYDQVTRKLMCKTICHQENEVKGCVIMSQTRCSKAEVRKAFDELAALKLGIVKIIKSHNNRDLTVFRKISKTKLLEDVNFPQKLSLFGMTVEKFASAFDDVLDNSAGPANGNKNKILIFCIFSSFFYYFIFYISYKTRQSEEERLESDF